MGTEINPKIAACLLCVFAMVSCSRPEQAPPYDLIVRGGQVIDGSGAAAVSADVGVRDGKIATIGQLGDAPSRRTIDASGLTVTPGFIDLHTHSEDTLPVDGN